MKVTLEMEKGELLECCVCGEKFNGTAVLIIDTDSEVAEEVYCVPCDLQSCKESAKT